MGRACVLITNCYVGTPVWAELKLEEKDLKFDSKYNSSTSKKLQRRMRQMKPLIFSGTIKAILTSLYMSRII